MKKLLLIILMALSLGSFAQVQSQTQPSIQRVEWRFEKQSDGTYLVYQRENRTAMWVNTGFLSDTGRDTMYNEDVFAYYAWIRTSGFGKRKQFVQYVNLPKK